MISNFERCRQTLEGHLKFSWTDGYDHKRSWDAALCSSVSGCKDFVLFIYPLAVSVTNEKSNWSSKTQKRLKDHRKNHGLLYIFFLSSGEINSYFAKLFGQMEQCKQQSNFMLNLKLLWLCNVHNNFKYLLSIPFLFASEPTSTPQTCSVRNTETLGRWHPQI